jgi:uncharacterized protein YdaU (DUF1376 family)
VSDFPWFPLYVDDWMRATATMTDEQAGAYMRLLCHAWAEGGLPRDEATIRSIGRWSPRAWARIWPAVAGKWREQDGRLVNARQERERQGRDAFRDQRVIAGRQGAWRRWRSHAPANGETYGGAIVSLMANDSDPQVQPQVPPLTPPPAEGPRLTRAQRQDALRAEGPPPASWRDRCGHTPTCSTPEACRLKADRGIA